MTSQTLTNTQPSFVCQFPAASADTAINWFSQRLMLETDCSDVHSALQAGATDFVLLDVRSSVAFAAGHVHRQISEATLSALPPQRLLVVYCAGPHCNGADQAALKIARLGYPVKIMIGGLQGYIDEGFPLQTVVPQTGAPQQQNAACGC